MSRSVGDNAHVGGNYKGVVAHFNAEPHVVDGVVRRLKGSELHARKKERYLLEDAHLVVLDAPRYVVMAQQAPHQAWSAIDAQMLVLAHQLVSIADVVGMVVSEHYAFHLLNVDAVSGKVVAHMLGINTSINQHSSVLVTQKRAVSTAAASKTHKLQPAPVVALVKRQSLLHGL